MRVVCLGLFSSEGIRERHLVLSLFSCTNVDMENDREAESKGNINFVFCIFNQFNLNVITTFCYY